MSQMMFYGHWQKPIEMISATIKEGMSLRDLIDGERSIQAYLVAQLNLSPSMIITSEKQTNDGYADISIEPFVSMYPDVAYAYLIEIKYLKSKETYSTAVEEALINRATTQLEKYASDKILHHSWHLKPNGTVTLKKIVLIFHGRELKFSQEL